VTSTLSVTSPLLGGIKTNVTTRKARYNHRNWWPGGEIWNIAK